MDAKRLLNIAVELDRLANVETRHHMNDQEGVWRELAGCDPIEVRDMAEELRVLGARLAEIESLDRFKVAVGISTAHPAATEGATLRRVEPSQGSPPAPSLHSVRADVVEPMDAGQVRRLPRRGAA
jgi:hypothetical protein